METGQANKSVNQTSGAQRGNGREGFGKRANLTGPDQEDASSPRFITCKRLKPMTSITCVLSENLILFCFILQPQTTCITTSFHFLITPLSQSEQ